MRRPALRECNCLAKPVSVDDRHAADVRACLHRVPCPALREAGIALEALEEARLERPSLVVLDMDLPDASGYEIYRELRDTFSDSVPIVFLSADRADGPNMEVAALLLGADDWVAKPFVPLGTRRG